jgi:hypothetical protein
MKQTALEWLYEEFTKTNYLTEDEFYMIFNQAKEMEKQAHKETWNAAHQAGRFEGKGIAEKDWQTFEGYWEENFKSE